MLNVIRKIKLISVTAFSLTSMGEIAYAGENDERRSSDRKQTRVTKVIPYNPTTHLIQQNDQVYYKVPTRHQSSVAMNDNQTVVRYRRATVRTVLAQRHRTPNLFRDKSRTATPVLVTQSAYRAR